MLSNCAAGERPLRVCKEIQPVRPKGNQPWIFIGRMDAEAETPVLWPPDMKSWLTGKDPDAEKDWGEEGGRGRDGWMASSNQRASVWANSGRERRIGKPGVLLSTGWQSVGHGSSNKWADPASGPPHLLEGCPWWGVAWTPLQGSIGTL